MIDAREEVMTAVPASVGRRSMRGTTSRPASRTATKKSLRIERVFSDARIKPFDQIEWERRTAEITDESGKVIFKQENVEVPKS